MRTKNFKVLCWWLPVLMFGLAMAQPARLSAQVSGAPSSTPREAIMKFVSLNGEHKLNTREARLLLSGELTQLPPSVGPLAEPDKIIVLGDDSAVARLPAQSPAHQDSYFFLKLDGKAWTVEAGRLLAIPAFVWQLRDDLAKRQSRTPEDEATLRNLNLTLSTDRELANWFNNNKGALETLRSLTSASGTSAPRVTTGRVQTPETDKILEELSASALSIETDGILIVTIGGITDNSVGFLFAPGGKAPAMSKTDYIWIEPVGDNWFLFKTT